MKKQFLTHELSLKIKELGFNEKCFAQFIKGDKLLLWGADGISYSELNESNDIVLALLWQQAFNWFEEKHNLSVSVFPVVKNRYYFTVKKFSGDNYYFIVKPPFDPIDSEENRYDANIKCLKKLIELVGI